MAKPKTPSSSLPARRKVTRLERRPEPYVLPPERTSHKTTNVNINAEAHLIIRELRKFIVAMVFLTLLVVAAIYGS